MELHGRQIFDVLGKPLSLVTKFIFSLADGRSSGSHGGSRDGHYKPSPSTHSSITSNPLIPAFLLLTVGFVLLSLTPVRLWLTTTEDLPTLSQIFSFSRKKQTNTLPKAGEAISVWTKKQSGFYYCQGGTLFGNKPGEMMTQADALMSGFQPAGGEYCANSQPTVASSDNPSFVDQQPPISEASSANAKESSVLPPEEQPRSPMARKSVSVWAMKQFGSYYCQGDALFGSRPGKLMEQSAALKAGYQPSDARCTTDKPDQAFAGNPPMGSQQPSAFQNNSMPAEESLRLVSKKHPEPPKAGESVSVWVIKELGFYYCQGDVLFGHKPGQLMTQSDALTAGYQPSDARCTNDRPNHASAERLTSQIVHARR
jgi:hypothetical protein